MFDTACEASIAYFKIRNEGAVEISRKFVF